MLSLDVFFECSKALLGMSPGGPTHTTIGYRLTVLGSSEQSHQQGTRNTKYKSGPRISEPGQDHYRPGDK